MHGNKNGTAEIHIIHIFVNIEDKHFKIECSAIENTFVN